MIKLRGDIGSLTNVIINVDWTNTITGGGGTDTTPAATGTATATDGCGTTTVSFADTVIPGCGNTETITRTWTAIDECGNTSSCAQTIIVVDTTGPVITCPAGIVVECGGDTSPVGTGTATATDGCGTSTITFADTIIPNCGNTETIIRVWTATDECGNSSTCAQLIAVVDTTPPVVTCPPDITLECGDDTSPANTGTATGTDTCGTVTFTYADSSAPGCGGTQVITRTWTGTDECGTSTATCIQTITVVDTTQPVITCPADATVECGADTSPAATGIATATDGCGNVTITFFDIITSGPCGNTQSIQRTWVAEDECGNVLACSQFITVVDTTPPVIVCPANVTVECGDDTSPASTGFATGTDACGTPAITFTDSSVPGCGGTEIISRTWTATDECGNTSSCVQTITVVDTIPPTIIAPPDITIECGDDSFPPATGNPTGIFDTCSGVSVGYNDTSVPGCGLTEVITRTWTATDQCGNATQDIQIVTVVDTTPPVITCPADATVECGDDTSPTATGSATGTDVCGTVAITFADSSVPSGCGLTETITRTWTATDECGNTSSCVQVITVVDITPPVITCPADATVECGDDTSPTATGNATATDVCGTVAITFSDSSVPGCGLTETITRTWTATDECGNTSSCVQIITVVDTTPPAANCPADITVNNDPGICGAIVTYVVDGTDVCGGVTVTQTGGLASGEIFPVGVTTNTFDITDDCGNVTSCSFTVTVIDNEPPSIVCPADIVTDNTPGDCFAEVFFPDAIAVDNCGIASVIQTAGLPSGSMFPVGVSTIEYTATDVNGNTSVCSFTITVIDIDPPAITCPADITQTNDPGLCGANVTVPAPILTDNCAIGAAPVVVGPVTQMLQDGIGDLIDTPTTVTGLGNSIGGDVSVDVDWTGDFGGSFEEFILEGPDGSIVFSDSSSSSDCLIYAGSFTVVEATWNNWIATYGTDLTFILLRDSSVDIPFCAESTFQLTVTLGAGTILINDYNGTDDASDYYPVGTTAVTWTFTDGGGNSVRLYNERYSNG